MFHLLSRLFARALRAPVAEAVPAYYAPERAKSGPVPRLSGLEQMYGYFGTR